LWHAENNVTGLPAIVKAESFDYPLEDEADSSVRHEFAGEAPPPTTHGVDYLFASGLKHGSRLRIVDASDPDRVRAVITDGGSGAPSSFLVTGIPESRRGNVEIWRPVFLYREEPDDGSNRPVYRFIDALDNRPTAGELAMAIAEGKTELVTYRVSRSEHQKKKQRGTIWKTKVSDGPLVVTHTWERRPITVRFRDVTDPVREEPSRSEPESDLPETRDLIRLADGREFRGRFVYQDDDHIVFEIAVGRVRSKMTFPRDEVVEVVRSNGDAGEGDVDE
jgi:hypothetical protein